MRLFTAVEIDDRIAEQVLALSAELRRRVEQQTPAARLTWLPRDRLHITLRFIGEVDDRRAEAIKGALAAPLDTERFDVILAGAGAFPPRGAPRVLWAGISQGQAELIALEREVTARLLTCGVPEEDRPYRPHLTLARVRDAAGLRTTQLFEQLPASIGTSPVEAITLFQSRLSPRGPTYHALQSTSLRWKN